MTDDAISAIFSKWRRHDYMQLHGGEMTAQEKRTVVAVLHAVEGEVLRHLKQIRDKPSAEHWL